MHEIRVSVVSPEAADHGVAELWAAGDLIGYTILEDSDLVLRIERRRDHTAVVVGALMRFDRYIARRAAVSLRSHREVARVLRRAGYSDEFISEVLSQLLDPVDL